MAERYIPEHRRNQFKAKAAFKPDELRRRREEQQVEIRRQKRDENLAKRRGIQTRDGGIGVGGAGASDSEDEGGAVETEVREALDFACCFGMLWWCFFAGYPSNRASDARSGVKSSSLESVVMKTPCDAAKTITAA